MNIRVQMLSELDLDWTFKKLEPQNQSIVEFCDRQILRLKIRER